MRKYRVGLAVAALVFAGALTGCWWKKASTDSANLTSGAPEGFDSLATTDELTQLPSQTEAPNQQLAVESLPVEVSPVTPAPGLTAVSTEAAENLSHNQKIQTALKNAGLYQGAIDGKIGPASRKAIQTFQQNNGLKVDGKVGPKTWAALESYLNASGASTSSAPASATQ
ncbi:MAG: peptidoglycan-binding protein [Candidatus Omnitrophica bacterium]|nr:peptidoglycan-binding protein [Candidatus Omnitrophota bacterium]